MGENSLWSTGFWSSFAGYSCIGFSALPPGASYKSKWAANWLMNIYFRESVSAYIFSEAMFFCDVILQVLMDTRKPWLLH
jgi:hypothetical protein